MFNARFSGRADDFGIGPRRGGVNRKLETNRNRNHKTQELFLTGGAPSYKPISSVWEGSDGDLLEAMFKFYATIPI